MHERASKSGLFLMELIIVILFFSLASAVTVQLFVKSHLVSRKTVALTQSAMLLQNYAEVFRNSNGDFNSLGDYLCYDITHYDHSSFKTFYSEDWKSVSLPENNGFELIGTYSEKDHFHILHLSMIDSKNQEIIYELDIEKYVGNEVAP